MGHAERGISHFTGFFTEDGAEEAFLRRQLGFALGGNFADENIAAADFGTDADDPLSVEVFENVIADIGDVAGDLFGAELGIAGVAFVFLNMHRSEVIVADEAFVEEDGVFVVITFPGHESHDDVAAQGQFALVGGGAVGQNLFFMDMIAFMDDGELIDAGSLIGAFVFQQFVGFEGAVFIVTDHNGVAVDFFHHAVGLGRFHNTGVHGGFVFHPGTDKGRFGNEERNGLTLHVGAHQGAVGVVVFKEGNKGGGHGNDLFRADVHVIHLRGVDDGDIRAAADIDAFVDEAVFFVQLFVGLGYDKAFFFVGGEVIDGFRYHAGFLIHAAVRRFDKAVFVDFGESGERTDKADVGTFRRFNGAHTAVMGMVNVSHFHTGTFSGETAGAEGRKTAFVGQFRQGVCLIHELGQLGRTEELFQRRHHGAGVDEDLRGDPFRILNGHSFLDDSFHAGEADAELVLQELADAADAAVAQMVDIVGAAFAVHQFEEAFEGAENIFLGQVLDIIVADLGDIAFVDFIGFGFVVPDQTFFVDPFENAVFEFFIEFIAADIAEVIAFGIEEQRVQKVAGGIFRGRFAGTELFIDFDEGFFFVMGAVFFDGGQDMGIFVGKGADLLIAAEAQCPKDHRRRKFAGTVDADIDDAGGVGFKFQPRAAVGDDGGAVNIGAGVGVLGMSEINAGRANQLRDDNAFGAVDDKGAAVGHQMEIAQKDFLFFYFTGFFVDETHTDF